MKPKHEYKGLSCFSKPKWSKNCNRKQFDYDITLNPEPLVDMRNKVCEELKDLSPIELFSKLYDHEVRDQIITETNKYAAQLNSKYRLDDVRLKRFLGILSLSGYHTLPSIPDYWSSKQSLGVPIVKQAMTRYEFLQTKKFIHFADNDNLDKNDKMAKVCLFPYILCL